MAGADCKTSVLAVLVDSGDDNGKEVKIDEVERVWPSVSMSDMRRIRSCTRLDIRHVSGSLRF